MVFKLGGWQALIRRIGGPVVEPHSVLAIRAMLHMRYTSGRQSYATVEGCRALLTHQARKRQA